jgi:ABC-type transport system involved in Fe-S cluster assembly fused permease/ATPase subunit
MNDEQKTEKQPSIWYLSKYLKPFGGIILITLVLLIAGRVFAAITPIWLKKIIDAITAGHGFDVLLPIIVVYFGLALARILFDLLRDVIFAPAVQGMSRTLSTHLYSHLLDLQVAYHHEQKIGALGRRIARGSRSISLMFDLLTTAVLPTFIQLLIVTGILLKLYSPIYAGITFATVVIYTIFTIWATDRRQIFRVAANHAEDEVAAMEVDTLVNIDTIKYFNNEPKQKEKYGPAISKWYKLTVSSNRLFSVVGAGQSLILLLGMGSILVLAIRQTLDHTLTIGDLVLLTTYVVELSAPIDTLGFIYRQLRDNITDLQGMAKIMAEPVTVSEPAEPKTLSNPQGAVDFNHVGFHYASNRTVFEDINLHIEAGQKVAFVGPSGVGKSTIVKLLFRFFDPTKGEVLIDGVPLPQLGKQTRHDLFAIVPQEPALFNTTIAENIRFGKPEATDAEVEEAAKLASIHDLITSLPEKYETLVGERGVKLSGGEKQRVAIARAIIRNPKVLVFDEATSSLDSNSEKEIQKSLEQVAQGRTTIAVAHRLSTIANSDRIYVLNKGAVAEQGTHAELLKLNGLYAMLWKTQAQHSDSKEKAVS